MPALDGGTPVLMKDHFKANLVGLMAECCGGMNLQSLFLSITRENFRTALGLSLFFPA